MFKLVVVLFALCPAVSAGPVRRELTPCSFVMDAIGEPNGTVREDHIGENRIGGTYSRGVCEFPSLFLIETPGL